METLLLYSQNLLEKITANFNENIFKQILNFLFDSSILEILAFVFTLC